MEVALGMCEGIVPIGNYLKGLRTAEPHLSRATGEQEKAVMDYCLEALRVSQQLTLRGSNIGVGAITAEARPAAETSEAAPPGAALQQYQT